MAHAERRQNISLRAAWIEASLINKMEKEPQTQSRYCLKGSLTGDWEVSGILMAEV